MYVICQKECLDITRPRAQEHTLSAVFSAPFRNAAHRGSAATTSCRLAKICTKIPALKAPSCARCRVYLRLIWSAREKKSRTTGGSSILLELKRLVVLACNLKVVQNAALTPRPERTAEKCPYARKGAWDAPPLNRSAITSPIFH